MKSKMKSEASSSNSRNIRGESVVVDCGRRRSSCGYCRSSGRTSISHGLWANSITVDDYQDLLDRGWRRSGCFLYKPQMDKTCCPAYTIRLRASDFVHSKEQLRVHRRMLRFLDGTLDAKKPEERDDPNGNKGTCNCGPWEVSSSTSTKSLSVKNEENKKSEGIINCLSEQIDNVVSTCIGSGEFPSGTQLPKASVKKIVGSKRKLLTKGSEDLLYSSNIAFQIAGALGRAQSAEKNVQKLRMTGHGAEKKGPTPQIIAEKLIGLMNQLPETFGLSIRACNGHINFYTAAKDASSDKDVPVLTVSEESTKGSERKICCCRKSSECPQLKRRRLEIHLKRSSFDPEEFSLYRRYQTKVHNDSPDHLTESSYRRFLVDTPLVFVPPSGDGKVPPCGFGSFHQQYLIDGQLVAVGVIDILPKCLSCKYLFWDPDYAFLSLGKYSALQEVGWVKENQAHCPSLQFYYLGYYIHSCSKMRYKAAYRPSELLCPLRYQWIPFDIVRPLLDRKKYVVFSDFATTQNGETSLCSVSETMEQQICVDHSDQEDFKERFMDNEDDEEMIEPESDSSGDELGPETSDQKSGIADDYVTNILIGLKGSRFRYKVHMFLKLFALMILNHFRLVDIYASNSQGWRISYGKTNLFFQMMIPQYCLRGYPTSFWSD